jgi:hypothetical protein
LHEVVVFALDALWIGPVAFTRHACHWQGDVAVFLPALIADGDFSQNARARATSSDNEAGGVERNNNHDNCCTLRRCVLLRRVVWLDAISSTLVALSAAQVL